MDKKKQYYSGDIIMRNQRKDGTKIEWMWGTDLMGVIHDTVIDRFTLFHRPFKNRLKHLIWVISKTK